MIHKSAEQCPAPIYPIDESQPCYDPSLQLGTYYFNGFLGDVTGSLKKSSQRLSSPDYWMPGHLIRGLIDAKIEDTSPVTDITGLISHTTEVVADIYSGQADQQEVCDLLEEIEAIDGLVDRRVQQTYDGVTATASGPGLSSQTARDLADYIGHANMLVIPLGHGGTIAGLHVSRHYQAISGNDTRIYPIRFSTQKLRDPAPEVSAAEAEFLKDLSDGREVVLFDTDVSSGETMARASTFFSALLESRILPVANDDCQPIKSRSSLIGIDALEKKLAENGKSHLSPSFS